jgi:hypothetical protein
MLVMGVMHLKKGGPAKDVADDWDNFQREFKGFDSQTGDIFSRIATGHDAGHDAGPLSVKINKSKDRLTVIKW